MKTVIQNLKPPSVVKGLTKFDEKLFEKPLKVCYFHLKSIKPASVLPILKQFLLKMEHFKPIQTVQQEEFKIFLNPEKIQDWTNFPAETITKLKEFSLNEDHLKTSQETITYQNYSANDCLNAILPQDKEGVSSFTQTGHIVHVNLREHLHPYKKIIGKILFDKVPNCKSVINKTNMIDNTYRNFQMEVLEGSEDTLVEVKENRCTFKFDFATVYWNSRLCTEHERIVKKIEPGDVLFDVFAGVGPFSIPLAKKKCQVFANDLNPESFKWLNSNAKTNKVDLNYIATFNKDARDFIREDFKQLLPKFPDKNVYITMNLPGLAVSFLKEYINLFEKNELENRTKPIVLYVYCFTKGEDSSKLARSLINEHFAMGIDDKIQEIFKVRTVSSLKDMMRVAVKLDEDILCGNKRKCDHVDNDAKKICCHGEEEDEQRV